MQILDDLGSAQRIGGYLDLNMDIARAMFRSLEAYLISKGKIEQRHLHCLLKGIFSLLGRCSVARSQQSKVSQDLEYHLILKIINQMFDFFTRRGFPQTTVTYSVLINMSAKLRRVELLQFALRGFTDAGLSRNVPMCYSLLRAAGDLQKPSLLRAAWVELRQNEVAQNDSLELARWRLLARSARLTGLGSYVADQVDLLGHQISGYIHREILKILSHSEPWAEKEKSIPELASFTQRKKSIQAFCVEMGALLTSLDERLPGIPFKLSKMSIWELPDQSREQWHQELYEEISVESHTENTSVEGPLHTGWSKSDRINWRKSTTSSTGFSISRLRYLNCKSINSLLIQAEVWESKKNSSGNSTRTRGSLMEQFADDGLNSSLNRPDHRMHIITLRMDLEEEASIFVTKEQWRARVLNLRSPNYRPPPSFR